MTVILRILFWLIVAAAFVFIWSIEILAPGTLSALNQSTASDLFKATLPTTAFIIALYALFFSQPRLRANSENALIAVVFSSLPNVALALGYASLSVATLWNPATYLGRSLIATGIVLYAAALLGLLWWVFFRTYGQLYNLRDDKQLRYFKPIRALIDWFKRDREYEIKKPARLGPVANQFVSLAPYMSDDERKQLGDGAILLICGEPNNYWLPLVAEILEERLSVGETVNVVAADRHPWDFWAVLSTKQQIKSHIDDIVFIDAYSRSFGFTDDIHPESDAQLRREGVVVIPVRTFAGLHTGSARAFNVIKAREAKKSRFVRRPNTMIYAYTSALADLEGVEQFRVFWRHVAPSERRYGMASILVEDSGSPPELLRFLKQLADFVIEYKCIDPNASPDPAPVRTK